MLHFLVAIISIEVSDKFVELDSTNLDIRCLVSDNSLIYLNVIQLTRAGTNIVSATMDGKVFWQDEMLKTRSCGFASLTNVLASFLNLTIPKSKVRKEDMGVYFCGLSATKRDSSLYFEESEETFINITGSFYFFKCFIWYTVMHNWKVILNFEVSLQKTIQRTRLVSWEKNVQFQKLK